MRYFNSVVVALAALITIASATPVQTTSDAASSDAAIIEPRGNKPGIYMCDQPDWQGNCRWNEVKSGQCLSLPFKGATSFGPDPGLRCKLFKGLNCDGVTGFIAYPGTHNTQEFTEQYGRQVLKYNTYQCFRSMS